MVSGIEAFYAEKEHVHINRFTIINPDIPNKW
jgi:hypothetical protein